MFYTKDKRKRRTKSSYTLSPAHNHTLYSPSIRTYSITLFSLLPPDRSITLSRIIRPASLLPAGFEIESAELFDISFPQPVFLTAAWHLQ
jgi:hypothetical protein